MPPFTAVVRDVHGVRFVATAHSQRELAAQVVHYVRDRCDHVLWPHAATNVRELIARDAKYAAIETYFANVGQRWDLEWLELLESKGHLAHIVRFRCPIRRKRCKHRVAGRS